MYECNEKLRYFGGNFSQYFSRFGFVNFIPAFSVSVWLWFHEFLKLTSLILTEHVPIHLTFCPGPDLSVSPSPRLSGLSDSDQTVPLGRAGHRHRGADAAQGAGALAEGGGDHAQAEPQVGGVSR